jgi:hypothetical protein
MTYNIIYLLLDDPEQHELHVPWHISFFKMPEEKINLECMRPCQRVAEILH